MSNTVLENFGFIALVIAVAGTFISFVTPYWLVTGSTTEYIVAKIHMGLLAHCEPNGCTWLQADNMLFQRNMPGRVTALGWPLFNLLIYLINPRRPSSRFDVVRSI